MQVSLRQAHKIVEKLTARLTTFEITASARVNVWELTDAAVAFQEAREVLHNTINRHRDLIEARQNVRNSIRVVNSLEIDTLVAKRKRLLDTIASLRSLLATVDKRAFSTPDALLQKVAAVKESSKASSSHYGSTDEVSINLLDVEAQEMFDREINYLQLEIEATEDQLTQANVKGSVVIDAGAAALLQAEGIVA